MKKFILPGIVLALGSSLSLADHMGRSDGLVLSLDVGEAVQDIDSSNFPSGTRIDDHDIAVRGGIGFRAGQLSGNIGYLNFGQTSVDTPTMTADAETYGLTMDMSFDLPLTPYTAAFVKAGVISWEQQTDEQVKGSNIVDRYYENGADPFWGVGFRFSGVPGMDVKIEYDRFNFDGDASNVVADYDLVTAGIEFLF